MRRSVQSWDGSPLESIDMTAPTALQLRVLVQPVLISASVLRVVLKDLIASMVLGDKRLYGGGIEIDP